MPEFGMFDTEAERDAWVAERDRTLSRGGRAAKAYRHYRGRRPSWPNTALCAI